MKMILHVNACGETNGAKKRDSVLSIKLALSVSTCTTGQSSARIVMKPAPSAKTIGVIALLASTIMSSQTVPIGLIVFVRRASRTLVLVV